MISPEAPPLRVLVAMATATGEPAETALVESLLAELRQRGHDADAVVLPLPATEALMPEHACAWRLLDLSSSNARPVDVLIATTFPAWCARHPRKVAWIVRDGTPAADPPSGDAPADADAGRPTRARLVELDARALAECRRVFVARASTADRLRRSSGIAADVLPPPPITGAGAANDTAGNRWPGWDSIIEQLLG